MANRILTTDELNNLFRPMFADVVARLESLSSCDEELLFALRRKLFKELSYLERDKPGVRRKLKDKMCEVQNGICPECGEPLPSKGKGAHLHRKNAKDGYVETNVSLVHDHCHIEQQKNQKYA